MNEERAVKESKHLMERHHTKTNLNALINCSKDLIWSVDKDLMLITANKAFGERVQVLTKNLPLEGESVLYKEFGVEVNEKWKEYYARALQGKRFTVKEELYNTATNRIEYGEVTFNPMYNHLDELFGVACFSKDVTEDTLKTISLEMAKKDLQKSNERFEYAAEATSDIIWDWNLETNEVYYSNNIEKLFGHKKAGTNADNLPFYFEHVHPEDRERVLLYPEEVKFGKMSTWSQEYRFKKANGDYAIVLDKGIVLRDENGTGKRMIGAIQDITIFKKQNERLQEIALINAHEIRRPVATILGLVHLFAIESTESEATSNLLKHLETATLELDDVIKRIIGKTES